VGRGRPWAGHDKAGVPAWGGNGGAGVGTAAVAQGEEEGVGGGWGAISRELHGRVISQFFDMDLQRKKYYLQFSCQTAASTDVVVAILDVVVEILG
jgi:hypothetical protein